MTPPADGVPSPSSAGPRGRRPADPLLVVPENRFAWAALERAVRRPGPEGRLVFLYGPSGCGKTRLVDEFLVLLARSETPPTSILRLEAREFSATTGLAAADPTGEGARRPRPESRTTRSKNTVAARRTGTARAVSPDPPEVFVCEDLAHLDRRREIQIRLIGLLDDVLAHGGRVILTADVVPGDLPDLLPRLVGRCRGGVLAQIRRPQVDSRKSLLDHFARSRQIVLGTEPRDLLAGGLPVGPRELAAALLTLEAASRTARRPIDAALVRRTVLGEPTRRPVRLPQLAAAVAKEFGLPVAVLRQPDRRQSHVLARQCAMSLARGATDLSLEKIAAYFGRRNHSTVLHACGRIDALLAEDPALRAILARVRRTLELPEG